jgi:hypothetical protein
MLDVAPEESFALSQLSWGQSLASVPGASMPDVTSVQESLPIVSDPSGLDQRFVGERDLLLFHAIE